MPLYAACSGAAVFRPGVTTEWYVPHHPDYRRTIAFRLILWPFAAFSANIGVRLDGRVVLCAAGVVTVLWLQLVEGVWFQQRTKWHWHQPCKQPC